MFGKKKFLPYGRQFLAGPEYRAVRRVLKSPNLTQGPSVERFEQALKKATGAPYVVAVANGTVALDLAVRALKLLRGLKDGALALTTPNTFVASSNALLYNQLQPLFCDISPDTYNLSLRELERTLEKHNSSENKAEIELLLPVHFAGEPIDMPELWRLAQKYGPKPVEAPPSIGGDTPEGNPDAIQTPNGQSRLPIIEDAAHAIGSYYDSGQKVGSCIYSDACCFSFHPVKTVTTAEGGAITCRNPQLYELLLLLRNHGINRIPTLWLNATDNCKSADLKRMAQDQAPLWYYEMQTLGHNARLSDVHAALGIEQLYRLDHFTAQRRYLAATYNQAFQNLRWLHTPRLGKHSCPHLYVVQINFTFLCLSRNDVMRELQAQSIGSQVHYIPVPMQPFYRHMGYSMDGLENSQKYYCEALSLPLYPGLKPREQNHIIEAIYRLAEL